MPRVAPEPGVERLARLLRAVHEFVQLLVGDGDVVDLDQPIAEIDSDKATLELNAEVAGKIEFLVAEGDTVEVGQVVCKIDTSVKPEKKAPAPNSISSPTKALRPARMRPWRVKCRW